MGDRIVGGRACPCCDAPLPSPSSPDSQGTPVLTWASPGTLLPTFWTSTFAVPPSQCPNTKVHQGAAVSSPRRTVISVRPQKLQCWSTQQSLYRPVAGWAWKLQGSCQNADFDMAGVGGLSQPRGSVFLIRRAEAAVVTRAEFTSSSKGTTRLPTEHPHPCRCPFPPRHTLEASPTQQGEEASCIGDDVGRDESQSTR